MMMNLSSFTLWIRNIIILVEIVMVVLCEEFLEILWDWKEQKSFYTTHDEAGKSVDGKGKLLKITKELYNSFNETTTRSTSKKLGVRFYRMLMAYEPFVYGNVMLGMIMYDFINNTLFERHWTKSCWKVLDELTLNRKFPIKSLTKNERLANRIIEIMAPLNKNRLFVLLCYDKVMAETNQRETFMQATNHEQLSFQIDLLYALWEDVPYIRRIRFLKPILDELVITVWQENDF